MTLFCPLVTHCVPGGAFLQQLQSPPTLFGLKSKYQQFGGGETEKSVSQIKKLKGCLQGGIFPNSMCGCGTMSVSAYITLFMTLKSLANSLSYFRALKNYFF